MPTGGWLEPLLGHFDDPLVAAVAPRIVPAPRRTPTARHAVRRTRRRWTAGRGRGRCGPGAAIPFVPSAALLVRADVATGPELFDPALRGGEDVDLVWRLADAGWDVRYVPSSTVAHEGPPTLGAFLARRAFYGTTAGPLARRHGGALAPVHVSGWSLAVWVLVLARRPVLGTGGAGGVHRDAGPPPARPRARPRAAWRRTSPAAARRVRRCPTLASLTRAWSPALVLGLAFRRTRTAGGAGPARPRAGTTGRRTGRASTRCAPSPCTSRTTSPTARASGSAAPASARRAAHPARRLALPRLVLAGAA